MDALHFRGEARVVVVVEPGVVLDVGRLRRCALGVIDCLWKDLGCDVQIRPMMVVLR